MFDKSRHTTGRIIKASNREVIEFGNRGQFYEIGNDPVRGFGTKTMPGFYMYKSGVVVDEAMLNWASWDGLSESTLASNSIYVAFMENPDANGGEVGEGGGLSESNRTLTYAGSSLPGATGTPPYRAFSGNDYFTGLVALGNLLCGQNSWSIFMKCYGAENTSGFFEFSDRNGAVQHTIELGFVAGTLYLYIMLNGVVKVDSNVTNTPPTTSIFYIGVWYDGIRIRYGWVAITKPTKWSDFPSDNRLEVETSCQFTNGDFSTRRWVGNNMERYLNANLYFIVLSSECLIDNNS